MPQLQLEYDRDGYDTLLRVRAKNMKDLRPFINDFVDAIELNDIKGGYLVGNK